MKIPWVRDSTCCFQRFSTTDSHRHQPGLQADEGQDWTQSSQTMEMDAIYKSCQKG